MKILSRLSAFVLLAASLLLHQGADAWKLRRVNHGTNRKLVNNQPSGFNFLVSKISEKDAWCMSVVGPQHDVQLEKCDFVNAPPKQLWKFHGYRLWNDLGKGKSKCVQLKQSKDGAGMRLVDCSVDDPGVHHSEHFSWDNDGYIRPNYFGSWCLTNRGVNANMGDPILIKSPCLDRPDYMWTFTSEDPRPKEQDWLFELYNAGGCVQPKHGETAPGTLVILDDCDSARAWNVTKTTSGGEVMFRSRLDNDMCLQAGLGGDPVDGTKMRLAKCTEGEYLQQFSWDDFEAPIKLYSRDDLCMLWRGVNGNPGADPIIMTECSKRPGIEWSGDEIEES